MEVLRWKTRIALLWVFMAVAMSAHAALAAMEPGGFEKIAEEATTMGPGMLVFMSLFWWVPLVMAVLSVTLKDSANRWTNFILGIIFTILNIFHLTEHLAQPSAHSLLIVCSTIVVTALIAWFAWTWPKQEA